jgi:hypothetical protein
MKPIWIFVLVGAVVALAIGSRVAIGPRPQWMQEDTVGMPRAADAARAGAQRGDDAVARDITGRPLAPQPQRGGAPDTRSAAGSARGGSPPWLPPPHQGGRGEQVANGAGSASGSGHHLGSAPPGGGAGLGAFDSPAGVAPAPVSERAAHLPSVTQNAPSGLETSEQGVDDKTNGKEADSGPMLSVPLKGDVVPDAGTPALKTEGLVLKGGELEFTDSGMVTYPTSDGFSGNAGTVSFQITPNWNGSDADDHALVQFAEGLNTWENRLSLGKNNDTLRFIMIDDTGVERNVNIPIGDWEAGQPHQVAMTWGDALMSLYIDGTLVGQNTYQGTLDIPPASPLYVGWNDPNMHAGVDGKLTDLKVWGRALGADEVTGH